MKQDSADKARSGTGKWKQIEEELRELNASKDKFFSIISHDLRNPVTFIVGFSELLLNDLEALSQEEIKLYVTNIHRSAKNLYDLLENLLQWAELQRGRVDYQPVKVDLRELIETNANLLQGNASEKTIDLSYELDEDCVVYADRYMLNSVIQNLMSNAIKFTHLQGTVKISARRQGKSVEVSIIDTGIGISAEQLASLFQMDQYQTTLGTAGEKGTGLGLMLVKEFVEKNGGKISVESVLNKGTTFKFSVPAAK